MNDEATYGFDALIRGDSVADQAPETGWLVAGKAAVRRRTNRRFSFDAFDEFDHKRLFCLDGVVTNDSELRTALACPGNPEVLASLYDRYGAAFPRELRGNFAGFVADPAAGRYMAFTNHLGARPIFWAEGPGGEVLVSTDFESLVRLMRERGIETVLDDLGAYWLLTFGYMLDDRTLVKGARRLPPGSLLVREGGAVRVDAYWRYSNDPAEMGEREAISGFHERFSRAVNRGFAKDTEHGRTHMALLSGGLDSRMVVYYAHMLGYQDLFTVTFGQKGCEDEATAAAISAELGYDHGFLSLGRGDYLIDVDEPVRRNGGLVLYSGSAHAVRAYRQIPWTRAGLLHNGNLADVSHGDYIEGKRHTAPDPLQWAYSRRLYDRVAGEASRASSCYPNQEAFAIHTRGINGILNGSISALADTETDEPFLDADLVDFASHLPLRFKHREYLFLRMIEECCPAAARHPWQKWGLNPTTKNYHLTGSMAFKALRKVLNLSRPYLRPNKPLRSDMNPMWLWYQSNPRLREGVSSNFATLLPTPETVAPELLDDCRSLFTHGSLMEKSQVLTLFAAIRRLGLDSLDPGKSADRSSCP